MSRLGIIDVLRIAAAAAFMAAVFATLPRHPRIKPAVDKMIAAIDEITDAVKADA